MYTAEDLKTKEQWDDVYRGMEAPPEIDENMPRILEFFKERKITTVLDLGCGSGRHTIYLMQHGFKVSGIDISTEGIKKAETFCLQKNLRAALAVGSIHERLPYSDSTFDSIISIRVIHHGRIEAIRKTISEMERVLKPGGLLFVTVRRRARRRRSSVEIAPRTYVPQDGIEKGVVHYLFNKKLLQREFRNFKILDFWVDKDSYYCLLGELKSH